MRFGLVVLPTKDLETSSFQTVSKERANMIASTDYLVKGLKFVVEFINLKEKSEEEKQIKKFRNQTYGSKRERKRDIKAHIKFCRQRFTSTASRGSRVC